MTESKIEAIVNDVASFGKLNAILYFKNQFVGIENLYEDLREMFDPDEICYSSFNLDSMQMMDVQFPIFSSQKENSILKIIFEKNKEKIILELYENQLIIEHLVKPINIQFSTGYHILEKYRRKTPDYAMVFGFELSIFINRYESSLRDNLYDMSLHPIYVLKTDNINGNVIEKYGSDTSNINDQKVELINKYLQLMNSEVANSAAIIYKS